MPISAIDYGQGWLLSRLRQLYGDKVNARGVCFGLAHMAIQANLVGEHDRFIERLRILASIPENEFAKEIEAIRNARIKGVPARSIYEEIPAFLEGVMLYQRPHFYPDLFTAEERPMSQQAAILTAPLVSSQLIDEKGGLCAVNLKTGAYDQLSLTVFFDRILNAMRASPPIEIPLSFSFGANKHRISFNFNPDKKEWYIDDANQMNRLTRPITANTKISTLAQHFGMEIDRAFATATRYQKMIVSGTLYTTNNHQESLKLLLERLDQDPKFSRLYDVTKMNANPYLDESDVTWLEGCAYEGSVEQVEQLLENGAIIRSFQGVPVIVHAAIVRRDVEMQAAIFDYLSKHPERFQELSVKVVASNQLNDAIKSNSVEMVRLVVAYGAESKRLSEEILNKSSPAVKDLIMSWQSVITLTSDLTTAIDNYQRKNPQSRTHFVEQLREAIKAAEQALSDPQKNIDEIYRELTSSAEAISIAIKKDHMHGSPVLSKLHFGSLFIGTKSQLANQIDSVLQRPVVNMDKSSIYKPD